MKAFFICLLIVMLPGVASATAQHGELLIISNQVYTMLTTPLEPFFSEDNPRPEIFSRPRSTANWRGYRGTWAITNGALYLVNIDVLPLTNLFPRVKGPVKADWFTGGLRVPQGEALKYVHMGFNSLFAIERYIIVKKGVVLKERIIENRKFGANQSPENMCWVELGEKHIPYDGTWIDAHIIRLYRPADCVRDGIVFVTRGVFFRTEEGKRNELMIPEIQHSPVEFIKLDRLPEKQLPSHGNHVQIEAHYAQDGNDFVFVVDSIRTLEYGETIHQPTEEESKDAQPPTRGDGNPAPQP